MMTLDEAKDMDLLLQTLINHKKNNGICNVNYLVKQTFQESKNEYYVAILTKKMIEHEPKIINSSSISGSRTAIWATPILKDFLLSGGFTKTVSNEVSKDKNEEEISIEFHSLDELESHFKQHDQKIFDDTINAFTTLENYINKNVYENVQANLTRLKQLKRNITTWRFQVNSLFINPIVQKDNFIIHKGMDEKIKTAAILLEKMILSALEVLHLQIKDQEASAGINTLSSDYFEMLKCNDFKELIEKYGDENNLKDNYFKGLNFAPDKTEYIQGRILSIKNTLERYSAKLNFIDIAEYKRIGFAWVNNGYNGTSEDFEGMTLRNITLNSQVAFDERNSYYSMILKELAKGGAEAFYIAFLKRELTKHSNSTFLSNGNTSTESISPSQDFNSSIKLKTMSEVFISYSWDSDDHKNNVLAFADHLRQRGYDTEIDRTLSQQQTATDFTKMMHQAMQNHNKVVVVLSRGYKIKADGFIGGAGKEYQLLLNDIDENPKKYILVCLEKRSDDLTPFGLKGRDIVDVTTPDGMNTLDHKLQDVEQVLLSPVASKKPILSPQKPNPFTAVQESDCPIEIVKLNSEQSTASMASGVYKFVDFKISFDYKNKSVQTVNSFDFEIRFNRLLDANAFKTRQDGNDTLIQDSIINPIYKGQTKTTTSFPIKIASYNISQIINTEIRIKIYTADGETEKSFKVNDIKVNPNHIGSNPDKTDLREAFDIS